MTQWIEKINNAKSLEELENLRIDTLGKKGVLTLEFAKMKSVPNEDKKAFAENLNIQKTLITQALDTKKLVLEKDALNLAALGVNVLTLAASKNLSADTVLVHHRLRATATTARSNHIELSNRNC